MNPIRPVRGDRTGAMAPASMADSELEHELVQHAAALRSMARALVGAGDADNLVQDTLRALGSPPAEPRGMHLWALSARNDRQYTWPLLLQETVTDERGEAMLRGSGSAPVSVGVTAADHGPARPESR